MAIMKVGCPHCKAALKSSKPMPIGKQITCVKCQKRFAVSAELELSVTGESHAGTSHFLAETMAGLTKSPMADTPADSLPPLPASVTKPEPPPTPKPEAPVKKKTDAKPAAQDRKRFKVDDGKSVVTVRRQRRRWGGVVAGILLLLLLGGGGAAAVIYFPDKFGLQTSPASLPIAKAKQAETPTLFEKSSPVPKTKTPEDKTTPLANPNTPKAVSKSQQEKIDAAIDKGVRFLCNKASSAGNWTVETDKEHPLGYAALPALALLECKVQPTDPVILKAAEFIRANSGPLEDTYDLGLAVLLLDRLGDPRDEPLLQNLAMRLMAGQTPAGGWDYKCPVLQMNESMELLTFLQGNRPKIEFFTPIAGNDVKSGSGAAPAFKTVMTRNNADTTGLSPKLRELPIVNYHGNKKWDLDCLRPGDNSNTQFGLLGLWAARRHKVPTELSLEMAGARFQDTQQPSGGWGYAMRGPTKNTMTCVGLLGLAMSHGAAAEAFLDAASKGRTMPQTPLDDRFIKRGMTALGECVDGDDDRRGLSSRVDYYYLWTLERVGMLYQRKTFGHHDWYQMGVGILLEKQLGNGSWEQHYNPIADTSFALLFLRRSDLVRELTNNLQFYVALPKQ